VKFLLKIYRCDNGSYFSICIVNTHSINVCNITLQLVYVSMGASRPQKKKESMEYSSSLPPPPRDKLPVTLLLQSQYFEQLFCLMQSLSEIKTADRSGVSHLYKYISIYQSRFQK